MAKQQYVYSMNGENWVGNFETREGALEAAIAKCSGAIDPPGTVFVAEVASGEELATGLGKIVIDEMRARARGTEGGAQFLRGLAASQVRDLDGQLEKTVIGWLQKHNLRSQSMKVEAISEHAVPMPHRGLSRGVNGKEVSDLGVSEFPSEMR